MKRHGWLVLMAWAGLSGAVLAGGFATGFEVTDQPASFAGDELHRTGGEPFRWNWSGEDIGAVSAKPGAVRSGSQGVDATRRTTPHSQAWWTRPGAFPSATVGKITASMAIRAVDWTDKQDSFIEIAASDISADDLGGNDTRSAWVSLKGNGRFYAWNGSHEQEVKTDIAVYDWQVIQIEIDVSARTYRVLLNGAEVARDLAFFNPAVSAVRSIQWKEYNNGKSVGGVYIDDIAVTVEP